MKVVHRNGNVKVTVRLIESGGGPRDTFTISYKRIWDQSAPPKHGWPTEYFTHPETGVWGAYVVSPCTWRWKGTYRFAPSVKPVAIFAVSLRNSVNSYSRLPDIQAGSVPLTLIKKKVYKKPKPPFKPIFSPPRFNNAPKGRYLSKPALKKPLARRKQRDNETDIHYKKYLESVSLIERKLETQIKLAREKRFALQVQKWYNRKVRKIASRKSRFEFISMTRYYRLEKIYKARLDRYTASLNAKPRYKVAKRRALIKSLENPFGFMELARLDLIGLNDSVEVTRTDGPYWAKVALQDLAGAPGGNTIVDNVYLAWYVSQTWETISDINAYYLREGWRPPYSYNTGDTPGLAHIYEQLRVKIIAVARTHTSGLHESCVRKLLNKLTDKTVHLGNIAAERQKTLQMLKDAFDSVWKFVKLKKYEKVRYLLNLASDPNYLSGLILQWKFGMEPLINDITTLTKELAKNSDENDFVFFSLRASKGTKEFVPLSFTSDGFSFEGRVSVSYVMKMSVGNQALRHLNRYGLTNPLEVLWEMTPWSFVIDWLIPVGQLISELTVPTGIVFRSGTRSISITGKFRFDHELRDPAEPIPGSPPVPLDLPFRGNFHGTIKDREIVSSFPIPSKSALVKNPYSVSHLVEAIALTIQRISGKRIT